MTAEFVASPLLSVPHGFFTRRGGVSIGPFASLNCALSGLDAPENVLENRARAARTLGADPGALVGLTQVHGDVTVVVTTPWRPGDGPRADAAVTARPGIALGIVTADCAPVLFADRAAGVVGAAHAGWRGALGGVLESTLSAMCGLGATLDHIAVVVGPCIGQASYEVSADLRDPVLAHDAENARFFIDGAREGRWQFDLAGYCVRRLEDAGVGLVAALGLDTLAEEDRFFSHRRRTLAKSGPIGHQISIITL